MPIYEYRCESCGHQQEALQKVSDAPLKVCAKCGKPTLSKMVTAAGFQLKGSGWYATDFKNSGSKPAAKASDSAPSADKPATETKTEAAKPATPVATPTPSKPAE
jgi:putative FmdB family regulatory protein